MIASERVRDADRRLPAPFGCGARKSEYDDKGNLTVQTDPLGHKTHYSYDDRGLVTQIEDAKGGTKVLAYNDAGALTRYMDYSGNSVGCTDSSFFTRKIAKASERPSSAKMVP